MHPTIPRLKFIFGVVLCSFVTTARAASAADAAFEKLARECIEELLVTGPEGATTLGDHRFDDKLTDYSPAARQANEAALRKNLAALAKIDAAALTGANRVDVQILKLN